MNKKLFFLIFTALCQITSAQNTLFQLSLDTISKIQAITPFEITKKGKIPLSIQSDESINFLLIDTAEGSFNALYTKLDEQIKNLELIQSFHTDSIYCLLYGRIKRSEYRIFIYDFYAGRIINESLNFDKNEEFLIGHYFNNYLHVLSINISNSELFLAKYNNSGELASKQALDIKSTLSLDGLYEILRTKDVGQYYTDLLSLTQHIDLKNQPLPSKSKVYYDSSHVKLLITEYEKKSLLIDINLTESSASIKEFDFPELICKPHAFYEYNSLLAENYLVQTKACNKEICVRLIDLNYTDKYEEYRAERNNLKDFNYSYYISEKESDVMIDLKPVEYEIKPLDVKQMKTFLRKVLEDDLLLTVKKDTATIFVTVGTEMMQTEAFVPLFFPGFIGMLTYKEEHLHRIFLAIDRQRHNMPVPQETVKEYITLSHTYRYSKGAFLLESYKIQKTESKNKFNILPVSD